MALKHPQEASRLDAPDFDEPIGTAGGEVVPCKRAGRVEPDGIGRGREGRVDGFWVLLRERVCVSAGGVGRGVGTRSWR